MTSCASWRLMVGKVLGMCDVDNGVENGGTRDG